MSVQAIAKSVRISPRKAGLVASLVRGRSVSDALIILDHTPKKGAPIIKKVVESARANATNNHGLDETSLIVSELIVGQGPAMKRFQPAAFGRARPYKRRTSHIKVVLDGRLKASSAKKAKPTKTEKA
ncbi:MAG TPA: 50S ribosomal protein L22 [Candidatus Saccharimonadales bacterium]